MSVEQALAAGVKCTCPELGACWEFDNECPVCTQRDAYDPCPTMGFGCGSGADATTAPCDCCTPDQYANARRYWT